MWVKGGFGCKMSLCEAEEFCCRIVSYTHQSVELVSCTIYDSEFHYPSLLTCLALKSPTRCNISIDLTKFSSFPLPSRTFCQLHSPLTIVKSCPVPATKPSNCGTPWPNANTQFTMKAIPIGCRASDSRRTTAIQLSFHAAGIAPSKSGT